jgi:opacity protein-like surface antigen
MIKKIMFSFFILTSTSTIALAEDKSYIGGSIGITDLGYTQYKGGKVQAGAVGKIFGGYGSTFGEKRKYYLGGELNLDLANYPSDALKSNLNYAMGASFIPGVYITTDTMIYGRLGIQANKFNYSGSPVQFGSQLGLGLQTKISKNWDARVEYINVTNVLPKSDNQLLVGLVYKFN